MPFHLNFENIDGFMDLHADEFELAVSNCIGFMGLAGGWNTITPKTWEEVARRVHIMQLIDGPRARRWNTELGRSEPYTVTAADVRRRIGLGSNANTRTAAGFNRRIIELMDADSRYGIRNAMPKEIVEA